MATNPPIWVTLVTSSLGGLLGGFLTFVGVMITQHYAKRREQAMWAREDAARSYEHRRAAYVDFTKEFHHRHKEFIKGDEAPGDYLGALYDRLIQIQIFGTREAAQLADEAFNILVNWVHGDEDFIPEAEDVLAPLREEIRRDLSIPDRSKAVSQAR